MGLSPSKPSHFYFENFLTIPCEEFHHVENSPIDAEMKVFKKDGSMYTFKYHLPSVGIRIMESLNKQLKTYDSFK
ncbi:MAG: hypothetical protein PHG66_06420 [Candidatus Colwellbacteria bacterium]|nr:hypothetical protein [Candidatus Colwellbacteria bacterium]